MLTECNKQWEHSDCVVYQARLCLTYTSCLFCVALWVILYQKVILTYPGVLSLHISLSFSLSSCLPAVWTVSCRMSCLLTASAASDVLGVCTVVCVCIPSLTQSPAEICTYSCFFFRMVLCNPERKGVTPTLLIPTRAKQKINTLIAFYSASRKKQKHQPVCCYFLFGPFFKQTNLLQRNKLVKSLKNTCQLKGKIGNFQFFLSTNPMERLC